MVAEYNILSTPFQNTEAQNAELEQQLTRTKVELSRAEETIRKKEQQIEEMVSQVLVYKVKLAIMTLQ